MASGAVRSKAVAMSLLIHCLLSLQLLWGFKQGDSNSEIIICFVLKLSHNQILQLMRVITVLGFNFTSLTKTICGIVGHCFVLQYIVSFIVLQSSRWSKRELVALLKLCSECHAVVNVL